MVTDHPARSNGTATDLEGAYRYDPKDDPTDDCSVQGERWRILTEDKSRF